MAEEKASDVIGAVDLGSNSFHMVVGRVVDREIRIIDRIKEPVRLAEGFRPDGSLSRTVQFRALDCLERFGQRLRFVEPHRLRVVGTNTLRKVQHAHGGFLELAQEALGHPIEVISGREEARLVYLGVAHSVEGDGLRRLVVDIGGGSTECIIGEGLTPIQADSLYMGCVSFSGRFFKDGRLSAKNMAQAIVAARRQLGAIEQRYRGLGWQQSLGSSGTIRAVADILHENEWCQQGISATGLHRLSEKIIAAGSVDALKLPGLKSHRQPVIAGGVAILMAIFQTFGLEQMIPSAGALREGVLYEILGRIHHKDIRDATVKRMAEAYRVDPHQGERVEGAAERLFEALKGDWAALDREGLRLLKWAAQLHEVGQALTYAGHHKHGAYLLTHSDMPGFSKGEQALLAALVRLHRRRYDLTLIPGLGGHQAQVLAQLAPILRLAVLLNRSHSRRPLPDFAIHPEKKGLALQFPEGWLESHPLTLADLKEEAHYLARSGFILNFA